MNLTQFLMHVDAIIANSPQEKLAEFIHNAARGLPEYQRADFLEKLRDAARDSIAEDDNHLTEQLCQVQEELQLIEKGGLCLVGDYNEEYDDWYSSLADEFIFRDPDNIAGIVENACDLLHQCVDNGHYQECYELANKLITLKIEVEGDYSDYRNNRLSLPEIQEYELGTFDYRQLIIDALSAAYWSNPLPERPAALYRIILNSGCSDLTLEALLQAGKKELGQLPGFLELWIDYLGTCTGKTAERLLSEAVALQNDTGRSLEAARKFYINHPGLYEQILQQNLKYGKDEEQFHVGLEALSKIQPQHDIVRCRVALLTAVYALRMNKQKEAELCWLEAYRSDTRAVHYLRLAVESSDFSEFREEARNIYHNCFDQQYPADKAEENRIDRLTYFTLAFLGGEFRHVLENGMNEKQPLGWSFTFMKMGLALFLLYLFQEDELPVGCRYMCDMACETISFTSEQYSQGLLQPVLTSNTTLFWECFRKWKLLEPVPVKEEQWIMNQLEDWIKLRVDGIMKGNHRKYYRECAAFIAALGEVKASRGIMNGKADLMESYRAAYSRRTAFHKELVALGMEIRTG